MRWRSILVVLNTIAFLGISAPLLAKEGLYFGGAGIYNTVSGQDFNGQSTSMAGNETLIQPGINDGFGLGILGGYNLHDRFAFEMSFFFSEHDGAFRGESFGVSYGMLNMDLKVYFETLQQEEPAFPYLLIGIGFHSLDVERGARSPSGSIRDVSYSGVSLNLGIGADHYISPDVSVTTGAVYRIVQYDKARSLAGIERDINTSLTGDGFGLVLAVSHHF